MMADLSVKQSLAVIVAAIILIVASVLATVFTVNFSSSSGNRNGRAYLNVTFTDAVLSCQEEARKTYGSRIQTLVTDNHSSFLSHQEFLFKIFLKMDLYGGKGEPVVPNYINCFVHSGDGKIREFDVLIDSDDAEPKDNSNTNRFGMPRK